jgi:hypothetical protein
MRKMQEHFSAKESTQRKGDPDAACFLRFSHLSRVAGRDFLSLRQRAASLPHRYRAIPDKCSDARRGIRDILPTVKHGLFKSPKCAENKPCAPPYQALLSPTLAQKNHAADRF